MARDSRITALLTGIAQKLNTLKSTIDSLGGGGKNPLFPVWAEENSSLQANGTEWAFGNGANTPQDQGVVIPFDSNLVAAGLSLQAGTATVGIYRNGTKVYDVVSGVIPERTNSVLLTPVLFSAGDVVGFRTTTASGTASPNQVVAWFREV